VCPLKPVAPAEYRKAIEVDSEFIKVPLDSRVPDRAVCIGMKIGQEEQAELLAFLDKNSDVFTWTTSDLLGVSRDIMKHMLQVNPSVKPRKHKLRKMFKEKVEAAKAEVQRLLDAGFIREVTYPQWLANVVMVCKNNRKWRMCTDFTDLNKYCPKDDSPLVRIDKIVDSIVGCEIMAFLDCFSGYHQIWTARGPAQCRADIL
jgi:hypothetical protein